MPDLLPSWDSDDVESLRPFARVRLVALDIDGTTVSTINGGLFATIQGLQSSLRQHRYGVNVTIATGRTFYGISTLLNEWRVTRGVPLILYNGSVVVPYGEQIPVSSRTIELTDLEAILEICQRYNGQALAYSFFGTTKCLFPETSGRESVVGWTNGERTEREFNGMTIKWESCWKSNLTRGPNAILLADINTSNAMSVVEALDSLQSISVTRSSANYLEVRPKGSNKGVALSEASASAKLSREQVLALGDNDNDAEMLAWAGIGIAVSSASEQAKKASRYICRHGVSESVVEVLRLIKHARRFFPNEGETYGER